MPHRVILTAEALGDFEEIGAYIYQSSPQNSFTVGMTLLREIESLDELPERFKIVGRSRKLRSSVHSMVVRPFVVYYRVDTSTQTVHVLRIIHGARRQPKRFE